jgi:O-antigen/teichoic acid export membrane protein
MRSAREEHENPFARRLAISVSIHFERWRQVLATVVAARPHDTSTQVGRSKERYRRVVLTGTSSVLTRSVSVLTMLVSVPITLHYLHQELYALWATISSTIAMLSFADFGLGNGLLNAISESDGKSNQDAAQQYFSSAFYLLSAIGFSIALLALIAYPHIPWSNVYNVRSETAIREAGPAALTLILCFAINIPLGIVGQVQSGYQEGFKTNLWSALGTGLSLVGVLIAVASRTGLPWLILAMSAGPILANIVNFWTWRRDRRWPWPSFGMVSAAAVGRLLHSGALFFILQLAISVGYQSDTIVIAHVLGVARVTDYVIPARMFSIAPVLFNMAVMPTWPAFGEAFAAGDFAWVRSAFGRVLRFSMVAGLAINPPLIFFGSRLVHLWVGKTVSPPLSLFVAFGVWGIQSGLAAPLTALLNGINAMRLQALCAAVMAVTNILSSIYLARHIGIAGVIWATIVTHFVFVLVPCGVHAHRILSRMSAASVMPSQSAAPVTLTAS